MTQVIKGVAVAPGQVVCGVQGRKAIVPVEPAMGNVWYHPQLPELGEDMTWDDFRDLMLRDYGLTVLYRQMQDDPNVPWEDDLDIALWEPECPFISDDAFLLILGEDEDGPFATWALPVPAGSQVCGRCGDHFTLGERTERPDLCWDCVTGTTLIGGEHD